MASLDGGHVFSLGQGGPLPVFGVRLVSGEDSRGLRQIRSYRPFRPCIQLGVDLALSEKGNPCYALVSIYQKQLPLQFTVFRALPARVGKCRGPSRSRSRRRQASSGWEGRRTPENR